MVRNKIFSLQIIGIVFCLVLFDSVHSTITYDRGSIQNLDSNHVKISNGTSSCKKDSECNSPHGHCYEGSCVCTTFYSGGNCETDWRDDSTWTACFIAYGVYAAFLQLICCIFSSWQLYITFKYAKRGGWLKWTLTTYIFIIALVAGTIRVIGFLLDPHSIRNIVERAGFEVYFEIPLLMWLAAGFMIFLYWMELQRDTGIKQLVAVYKFRPFLVVFTIICLAVLFPINLWQTVYPRPLSLTIYNISLAAVFIFLVCCFTAAGFNLIRTIRATYSSAITHAKMDLFLRQLLTYIVILDMAIIVSAISLVIFTVIAAQTEKWKYVGMHTLLRLDEFWVVISTLVFIRKKKPEEELHTGSSVPISRVSTSIVSKTDSADSLPGTGNVDSQEMENVNGSKEFESC